MRRNLNIAFVSWIEATHIARIYSCGVQDSHGKYFVWSIVDHFSANNDSLISGQGTMQPFLLKRIYIVFFNFKTEDCTEYDGTVKTILLLSTGYIL